MQAATKLVLITCALFLALGSCHYQQDEKSHGTNAHYQHSKASHNQSNMNQGTLSIEKPRRISHTYEQRINGTIEEIMPLYCPVRELDWCENWDPKVVYSKSGFVEKDCIFITSHGEDDVVWVVTDFDPEQGHVKMFYHVPGIMVTQLEIQVSPITPKETKAILTYSKTSLSEKGDQALEAFTKESYDIMMDSWEIAMNHYLETGEMRTGLTNF